MVRLTNTTADCLNRMSRGEMNSRTITVDAEATTK